MLVLTFYRDGKYVIPMCQEAVHFLLRYLQSQDNSMLLKVFNLHIQIEGKSFNLLYMGHSMKL